MEDVVELSIFNYIYLMKVNQLSRGWLFVCGLLVACSQNPANNTSETNNLPVETPVEQTQSSASSKNTNSSDQKQPFDQTIELSNSSARLPFNNYNTLEELKRALEQPVQRFRINTAKDTVILGRGGTELRIPAGSFVLPSGQLVSGEIEFELTECLDLFSFFTNNLSTQTASNAVLQTAGSVKLTAAKNGQTLSLSPTKSIELAFPIPASQKDQQLDMETFYAANEPGDFVRWQDRPSQNSDNVLNTTTRSADTTISTYFIYLDSAESEPIAWKFDQSDETLKDWMKQNELRSELLKKFATENKVATVKVSYRSDGSLNEVTGTRMIEQELKDAIYNWLRLAPKMDMQEMQAYQPYPLKLMGTTIRNNTNLEKLIDSQTSGSGKLSSKVRTELVTKYVITANQLGWVNCDKYYNSGIIACTITLPYQANTDFMLISEKAQAVFQPTNRYDYSVFTMVPKGENYRLFAIRNDESGLFYNELPIQVNQNSSLDFAATMPIQISALKQRLKFAD